MATSKISTSSPVIKSKTVKLTNITIGSSGYIGVGQHKPSGMNHFLFCMVKTYGTVSTHTDFDVDADGVYMRGTANATIDSVTLVYFYTD